MGMKKYMKQISCICINTAACILFTTLVVVIDGFIFHGSRQLCFDHVLGLSGASD
jgi:hypothetical protein